MDILGGQRWILGGLRKRKFVADAIRLKIYESEYEAEHPWISGFSLYPLDSNGYSIVPTTTTGNIFYISSSGNDTTAQIYTAEDYPDAFNPTAAPMSFATFEAAWANKTDGQGDMFLFLGGDTVHITDNMTFASGGYSATDRLVIGTYGNKQRARIIPDNQGSWLRFWNAVSNVAVLNIELYDPIRTPTDPLYNANATDSSSLAMSNAFEGDINTILFENCRVDYAGLFVGGVNRATGKLYDLVIRKCQMMRNYPVGGEHTQGVGSPITSILFEENYIEHGGWFDYDDATQFNHNSYFTDAYNSIFRNNISIVPSSIHFKFTANVEDFYLADSLTGVTSYIDITQQEIPQYFPQQTTINVIANDGTMVPVNVLSWSGNRFQITPVDFTATPADTGNAIELTENYVTAFNVAVYGNVMIDGEVGVSYGGNKDLDNDNPRFKNFRVAGNILTDIGLTRPTQRQLAFGIESIDNKDGFMSENLFLPVTNPVSDNRYAIKLNGYQSGHDVFNNVAYGMGDIDKDHAESEFNNLVVTDSSIFVNGNANILTYLSDNGYTASYDEFMNQCRAVSKDNYNNKFTAMSIQNYLRKSYAFKDKFHVIQQPSTPLSLAGEDMEYIFDVIGNTRLTYQWFDDAGNQITGETTNRYIRTIQLSDDGLGIFCRAFDEYGNHIDSTVSVISLASNKDADLIQNDFAGTDVFSLSKSFSQTGASEFISVDVEVIDYPYMYLQVFDGAWKRAHYDLTGEGTVMSGNTATKTITKLSDGVYRLAITSNNRGKDAISIAFSDDQSNLSVALPADTGVYLSNFVINDGTTRDVENNKESSPSDFTTWTSSNITVTANQAERPDIA